MRKNNILIPGTLNYMAPELKDMHSSNSLNKSKYLTNEYICDVFSLGLVFLKIALLLNKKEFNGLNEFGDESDFKKEAYLERVNEKYGNISIILTKMLELKPKKRPDFIKLEEIWRNEFKVQTIKSLEIELSQKNGIKDEETIVSPKKFANEERKVKKNIITVIIFF